MIRELFLMLLSQTAPARPAPPMVERAPALVPSPPADWLLLPELRFRRRPDLSGLSDYVRGEVQAGRCTAERAPDGQMAIHIDLAVLVAATGPVRRIVPRAINCPTVEQYATGLVEKLSRDNLAVGGTDGDAWYHAVLDFTWRE